MRGKASVLLDGCADARITPAYAGKSCTSCSWQPRSRDHPRMCGEKYRKPVAKFLPSGSPPRMRGKGLLQIFVSEPLGITPAYAGKSAPFLTLPGIAWDHPRVCREKAQDVTLQCWAMGSPPRVRGKGHLTLAVRHMHRITPAYAGKSDILHPTAHYGRQIVRRLCRRFKRA